MSKSDYLKHLGFITQTARTMSNIKGNNHNHAEAFCHMVYHGKSANGSSITLSIWNSRDGVTPFMMSSEEYGIQMQHINWQHDRYDPGFKPRKGDFIWRNYTEQEAKELAQKQITYWTDEKSRLEGLTNEQYAQQHPKTHFERTALIEQLTEVLTKIDEYVKETVKRLLENGEPFFEVVTEDWP